VQRRTPLLIAAFALAALSAAPLTACAPVGGTPEIALLLPDKKTARYETFDRPVFEERVAERGEYDVLYANADQDAAKQQQQAESALAAGVKVLVLDPVDAKAAATIVGAATAQGVPVVAYDRLIDGGGLAYYISFDNVRVGELQAEALGEALAGDGNSGEGASGDGILMVNGSPTDSNAALFREGARRVLEERGVTVLAEYSTPDWSPDKAQDWVAGQISQYGDRIAAVYAANDGTASGAIAALRAADVDPLPPVTGQDAELTAIQRILTGDQYMTVYKALRPQAQRAADVAVDLVEGRTVTGDLEVDGTPATLLVPVAVRRDDILTTVIADGFWTAEDICTPAYAAACAAAGIREDDTP